MTINVNPLGWKDNKITRDINKGYVNSVYSLIVPNGEMLPFQISHYISSEPTASKTYTFTFTSEITGVATVDVGLFNFTKRTGSIRLDCKMRILDNTGVVQDYISTNPIFEPTNYPGTTLVETLTTTFTSYNFNYPLSEGTFSRVYIAIGAGSFLTPTLNIPNGSVIEITDVKFYDENNKRIYFTSVQAANDITLTESGIEGFEPYTLQIKDESGNQVYNDTIDVEGGLDSADNNFYNLRYYGGSIGYNAENGVHEAIITDGEGRTWYSEYFCIINDLTEYIKIEYASKNDIQLDQQTLVFDNSFNFVMYIDSKIARPEYIYEEEAEEKNGYKFISNQVAKKLYKFSAPMPEFLVDASMIIRLCDFVKIIDKFQQYNLTEFLMTPEFEEWGDVANVDCEFSTGAIVKKVNGFRNIDNLGQYSATQYNGSYKNQIG